MSEYKYSAIDSNGGLYEFTHEPELALNGLCWDTVQGGCKFVKQLTPVDDWKESLKPIDSNWVATNYNGSVYRFTLKPTPNETSWTWEAVKGSIFKVDYANGLCLTWRNTIEYIGERSIERLEVEILALDGVTSVKKVTNEIFVFGGNKEEIQVLIDLIMTDGIKWSHMIGENAVTEMLENGWVTDEQARQLNNKSTPPDDYYDLIVYNWEAVNSEGKVIQFTDKPEFKDSYWCISAGYCTIKTEIGPALNWKESLRYIGKSTPSDDIIRHIDAMDHLANKGWVTDKKEKSIYNWKLVSHCDVDDLYTYMPVNNDVGTLEYFGERTIARLNVEILALDGVLKCEFQSNSITPHHYNLIVSGSDKEKIEELIMIIKPEGITVNLDHIRSPIDFAATVADKESTPVKHADRKNSGKVQLSLVPGAAVVSIGRALTFGASKYAAHNWRKGLPYTEVADSLLRHMFQWLNGKDVDPDTGCNHMDGVGANFAFLATQIANGCDDLDDRYKDGKPLDIMMPGEARKRIAELEAEKAELESIVRGEGIYDDHHE